MVAIGADSVAVSGEGIQVHRNCWQFVGRVISLPQDLLSVNNVGWARLCSSRYIVFKARMVGIDGVVALQPGLNVLGKVFRRRLMTVSWLL